MFAPVYLDHNATTPLDSRVREAMLPYLDARFGNASSRHEYGRQARAAIDRARQQVAAAVNAHPTEVVFTSGGSEANNLFIKGAAACRRPGVLAVGASEHPCVREPARQLMRSGWQMQTVGLDHDGCIDEASWREALALRPALVSIMTANNETGVVQDIPALAAAAREAGACFHTDAVQALGKRPVDFRQSGVHALSLSAHKIRGPQGAGALVLDKRVELAPLIAGGGQERGLRSGTENLAAIVGMGAACDLLLESLADAGRQAALCDTLARAVTARGGVVFGLGAVRLPNTVFFAFDGIDGETLVGKLDRAGFAVASGSACSSADPHPSAALLAMGVDPERARGAVRVSLGVATQNKDVEQFVVVLDELVLALKRLTALAV